MNKVRFKNIITLVILMCALFSVSVKATEQYDNNIEYMSTIECNKFIGTLVSSIVDNNVEFMYNNTSYFESRCYDSIKQYLLTNSIADSNFTISDIIIDVTYPENSSTGDTVIMANTKIWYNNGQYNKVYLFEFHVNTTGDIYGFNVWVY